MPFIICQSFIIYIILIYYLINCILLNETLSILLLLLLFRSNASDLDSDTVEIPPHCHITIRCTREIAGFNGLGEAVRRLDFRSSVRDRRRFQYVCSLLRLLVSNKGIASLPGSAQRMLLQMLEEVASHGRWILLPTKIFTYTENSLNLCQN